MNLSWESLDKTRDDCRKAIEKDEEELAKVMARLLRNKKILCQAEDRARRKAQCLMSEMDAAEELEDPVDYPAADACMGLSPAVWSSINFLDNAVDPFFSGTALEASSNS